jgi:BirA family biotin operon repressor/biotin-[acetyl-CoA-carboxylase] ligase
MSDATASVSLPPGFHLVAHDSLPSTSDEAVALAASGAASGTLVWARSQSKGRGRQDRRWSSPPGNLYLSLILRPEVAPARAAELSFVAAIAVGDCVAALLPDRIVALKWPNDVLVDDAKIAGILLEASSATAGPVEWVVIGIGLNIDRAPDDTPYPATALRSFVEEAPAVETVLGFLAGTLEAQIAVWRNAGFAPIRARWLARARGLGQPVSLSLGAESLTGIFDGLDEDGALLLRIGAARRRITAGDVHFPGR